MTHQADKLDTVSEARLLPCPFCGEVGFVRVQPYQFPPDDDGPAWKWGHHVVCDASGIDGSHRGCGCSSAWGETQAEAITAWNRRPPPAETESQKHIVGGGVVKGLVWQADGNHFKATTPFGRYLIWPGTGFECLFDGPGGCRGRAKRMDEAKAAAQADYEARIRSSLVAPEGAEEVEALRNALTAMRPIVTSLIAKEHNVETWGLRQRLAAIDAALSPTIAENATVGRPIDTDKAGVREAALEECAKVAHEAHLRYAEIRDRLGPEQGTQRIAAEAHVKAAAAIWQAILALQPPEANSSALAQEGK